MHSFVDVVCVVDVQAHRLLTEADSAAALCPAAGLYGLVLGGDLRGSFSGRVVDGSGTPVPNAHVFFDNTTPGADPLLVTGLRTLEDENQDGVIDGDPFDPNPSPEDRFRQTNSGFGDPSVQLTVNLYGAPTIENFYDMANYEPRFTVDVGGMLAIPIGEYNDDKFVNIGLNRWWGRLSLPMVAYFGSYAPLYRTSFEVTPSVYLFAKNDDFLGEDLENDPLFQLEAHLTHDITRSLVASIDFMFRKGMESEINGNKSGEDLDIKTLGFTLDYLVTDNVGLRVSYHSNFIDDNDLDADMMRIQFNYGWNALVENVKMLEHH